MSSASGSLIWQKQEELEKLVAFDEEADESVTNFKIEDIQSLSHETLVENLNNEEEEENKLWEEFENQKQFIISLINDEKQPPQEETDANGKPKPKPKPKKVVKSKKEELFASINVRLAKQIQENEIKSASDVGNGDFWGIYHSKRDVMTSIIMDWSRKLLDPKWTPFELPNSIILSRGTIVNDLAAEKVNIMKDDELLNCVVLLACYYTIVRFF